MPFFAASTVAFNVSGTANIRRPDGAIAVSLVMHTMPMPMPMSCLCSGAMCLGRKGNIPSKNTWVLALEREYSNTHFQHCIITNNHGIGQLLLPIHLIPNSVPGVLQGTIEHRA